MKKCLKCSETKTLDLFNLKNKKTGTLNSRCKSCLSEYSKEHSQRPEVILRRREQKRLYWIEIKESVRSKRTAYMNRKRKTDINYKIANTLRARLSGIMKIKNKGHISFLGCDINTLTKHLESKFKPGMTWENHGKHGWHIDHIIPISRFDLTKEEDIKTVCNYTNLQPLWAKDNLMKSDKMENT